ncbi:Protein of unknown function [Selenomonas ruminantium]|uniref:DUF1097 domain-containing protein n=1 Tax=Selenomonas ruminantium TaxID=971 RepID=A0A1M6TBT5_SELRU|nr:DUF1097 domain-containing protein [Selenomonas ruminantium]SHK54228.1 Protein of unknown function [Selenomonas ruminantium]
MEQIISAIKNINREDTIMATASGLTAVFLLVDIPVWAVFIGWTWYLSIGADVRAIKEGTITCILGGILALSSVVCIDLLQPCLPWLLPNMIGVFPNILLLILSFKIPGIQPLVGFNAFSCIFAGYYLNAFPVHTNYWLNIVLAFLYINGGNIIGLFEGYIVQKICRLAGYPPKK